jgi:hypothetical protein
MASTADLLINAEAGYTVTFTYCSPVLGNPGVPGPPIDVTDYTARMTIRSSYGDGAALTLTDSSGITVGTTDGTFTVAMTGEQTAQLPLSGVYDLLVTPPAEQPIRLVQGNISVNAAVTV